VTVRVFKHLRPSPTEGSVFVGTLEALSFRATLQYCVVLSSVTLALSSVTSVFSSDEGLFALI
jgi:hypothetical protein